MNKLSMILASAALLAVPGLALAEQPENPGQFGRDRAAALQTFRDGGTQDTAPGASEWGKIAAERAGDNGAINRDYRDAVGGSPTTNPSTTQSTPSQPSGKGK